MFAFPHIKIDSLPPREQPRSNENLEEILSRLFLLPSNIKIDKNAANDANTLLSFSFNKASRSQFSTLSQQLLHSSFLLETSLIELHIRDFTLSSYGERVHELGTQAGPLSENCELSVCIPVAAHEEYSHIYKTLECFRKQTLSSRYFEVLLLLNYPCTDDISVMTRVNKTFEEISRFLRTNPQVPIKPMICSIDPELVSIGLIRAVLSDIALYRFQNRKSSSFKDHLLMRSDADSEDSNPFWLKNVLNAARMHPESVAFMGRLELAPEALCKDPAMMFGDLFARFLYRYRGFRVQGNVCGGPNMTIRASAYVETGGYKARDKFVEDMHLDSKLDRLFEDRILKLGKESLLYTSARRAEAAAMAGFAPIAQWSNTATDFSDSNLNIRTGAIREERDFFQILDHPCFRKEIERYINQTLPIVYPGIMFDQDQLESALHKTLARPFKIKTSLLLDHSNYDLDIEPFVSFRVIVEDLGELPERLIAHRKRISMPRDN